VELFPIEHSGLRTRNAVAIERCLHGDHVGVQLVLPGGGAPSVNLPLRQFIGNFTHPFCRPGVLSFPMSGEGLSVGRKGGRGCALAMCILPWEASKLR